MPPRNKKQANAYAYENINMYDILGNSTVNDFITDELPNVTKFINDITDIGADNILDILRMLELIYNLLTQTQNNTHYNNIKELLKKLEDKLKNSKYKSNNSNILIIIPDQNNEISVKKRKQIIKRLKNIEIYRKQITQNNSEIIIKH